MAEVGKGTREALLRQRICRGASAVARCSGSAVIVTGATGTAPSDAGGTPTGGTSKARKADSITATGNGTTGNAAATGPA